MCDARRLRISLASFETWRRRLIACGLAAGWLSCVGAGFAALRADGSGPGGGRGAAPPTGSATFLLLDAALKEQRVELLGFRNGEISFRDESGRTQTVRLDDVAALLPSWWSPRDQGQESAGGDASLTPTPRPAPFKEGAGVLELIDGQRIGGGLKVAEDDGAPRSPDDVLWETGMFGEMSVKLDVVRRIRFTPAPAVATAPAGSRLPPGVTNLLQPPAPTQPPAKVEKPDPLPAAKADRVMLINGDHLSGFIEQIGPTVTIDAEGRKVDTPIAQVSEIRLLNEARLPKGTRLWLSGGTVIDAARLTAEGPKSAVARADTVRVELSSDTWRSVRAAKPDGARTKTTEADGGQPVPRGVTVSAPPAEAPAAILGVARFLAIVPHVESLVSLASRPVTRQEATEGRSWFEPVRHSWFGSPLTEAEGATAQGVRSEGSSPTAVRPPMGAADIELPGPMLVEWSIPPAATRIAGWAELPRDCWTWGHCTVVLSLEPGAGASAARVELLRETLSSEHPTAEFSVAIEPAAATAVRTIRVEVLSGERGPIQDRVLLRRVLLMCKPGAGK